MHRNYLKIVSFSFAMLVSTASFYEAKSIKYDPATIFEYQDYDFPRIKVKRVTGADVLHNDNIKGEGTTIALISSYFDPLHMEQYNQKGVLHPAAFRDKTILIPDELNLLNLQELKEKKKQLFTTYMAAQTSEEKERIGKEINDFANLYLKKKALEEMKEGLYIKEIRHLSNLEKTVLELRNDYTILLMYDSPSPDFLDLTIKPGELAIFSEGDKLYCKIHNKEKKQIFKADEHMAQGLDVDSFHDIQRVIKQHTQNREFEDPHRTKESVKGSFKINFDFLLFRDSRESLIKYIASSGYTQIKGNIENDADYVDGSAEAELLHSIAPSAKLLPLDLTAYGACWKAENEKLKVTEGILNIAKAIRKAVEEKVDVICFPERFDLEDFEANETAKQEIIKAFKEAAAKGIPIVLPAAYDELFSWVMPSNNKTFNYVEDEAPYPDQPIFLDEGFDDNAQKTAARFEKQLFDTLNQQSILFVGKLNYDSTGEEVLSKNTQHPRQDAESHFLLTSSGKVSAFRIPSGYGTLRGIKVTEEPNAPTLLATAGLVLLKGHVKDKDLLHTSEDLIKILHDSGHDLAHDTPNVPFTSYKVLDLPNAIKLANESLKPKPIETPAFVDPAPKTVVINPIPEPVVSMPIPEPVSTPTPAPVVSITSPQSVVIPPQTTTRQSLARTVTPVVIPPHMTTRQSSARTMRPVVIPPQTTTRQFSVRREPPVTPAPTTSRTLRTPNNIASNRIRRQAAPVVESSSSQRSPSRTLTRRGIAATPSVKRPLIRSRTSIVSNRVDNRTISRKSEDIRRKSPMATRTVRVQKIGTTTAVSSRINSNLRNRVRPTTT